MRLATIAAGLLLLVLAALPGRAAEPRLTIGRTSSPLEATLPLGHSLYIEVLYASDAPLRLQARAYRGGNSLDTSQMMNASVVYSAGDGRALVWVAYAKPAEIDEVRVTAYDAGWQPRIEYSLPAALTWQGKAEASKPGWVSDLIAAERRIAVENGVSVDQTSAGLIGIVVGLLIMAGLPCYLVFQVLAVSTMPGRWRLASLVPLVVMVPLAGHALFALAAGSNLWPVLVIVSAPAACIYLICLFAARSFAGTAADAYR